MRRRVILFLMKATLKLLVIAIFLVPATEPARAAGMIEDAMASVVRIKPDWPLAARGRDASGAPRDPQGTGIAILPDGYIATNVHVIGAATDVDVMLEDGRTLKAEVVGRDQMTDIALLKVPTDLPVPEMATNPRLAEPVCAIGNQFGLGLSVTCGVVSALGRSGMGFNPVEEFVQTDAAVNPGGSGGALVNRQAQLVGMVSAIFTKQSDADIGVNFATSVSLLMRVVEDLKAHGRVLRAIAGFKAAPLPPDLESQSGGALVEGVTVNGPAFVAGLEAGDVITRIDGRPVRAMPSVEAQIFMKRPGQTIELTTRRGSETRELTFVLGGS